MIILIGRNFENNGFNYKCRVENIYYRINVFANIFNGIASIIDRVAEILLLKFYQKMSEYEFHKQVD